MLENLIIPTFTRYDLLKKMLASIDYPIAHLLIIDNGANYRKNKPLLLVTNEHVRKMTYLPIPTNLGVAGGWNLGIKSFPFHSRWFIASDDVEFLPGGLEAWDRQSSPEKVTISNEWPYWQFFTVGQEPVKRVGLFDENYFPGNFEDDDYLWRCQELGIAVDQIQAAHKHVKQGTVFDPNLKNQNSRTYPINEARFALKQKEGLLQAGEWELETRRGNEWAVD